MESIREFLVENGIKDGEPIIPIEGHELGSIMTAEHFLEYWVPRLEEYILKILGEMGLEAEEYKRIINGDKTKGDK